MFDPYNPYGYTFPNQQMPQIPYPTNGVGRQFQQPQPQMPQGGSPVVLQVATVKQVEQAPVQPGGKALVLVANEPVIAMRSADNMGITTTDYYHIEKFDPDAAPAAQTADYVTRAEFQQAISSIAQKLQQAVPTPVENKEAESK